MPAHTFFFATTILDNVALIYSARSCLLLSSSRSHVRSCDTLSESTWIIDIYYLYVHVVPLLPSVFMTHGFTFVIYVYL